MAGSLKQKLARKLPVVCMGDRTVRSTYLLSINLTNKAGEGLEFLGEPEYVNVHVGVVVFVAVHTPADVDRAYTAGTRSSLSRRGPIGMMSLRGSRQGGWGESDMCGYCALLHIYHGTATVNDGIRGVRGGAVQTNRSPS